jgi:hypothetical protein
MGFQADVARRWAWGLAAALVVVAHAPVAPANVREHNRAVIQAKDQGPNRLKSLLTGIETT